MNTTTPQFRLSPYSRVSRLPVESEVYETSELWGTGGTKIWTPTLGWWPKRICPGPAGIRAWTHGTFGSLAMRSFQWMEWMEWQGFFTERHGKCRDRTGLRQYAAWMNCCSIFFKWKRRWWSMPAPYGDWSSWCWSCPYFDCTLGVLQFSKCMMVIYEQCEGGCAASNPFFLEVK